MATEDAGERIQVEGANIPMSNEPVVAIADGEVVIEGLVGSGPSFTAATARRLGLALIAAADALDAP